MAFCSACNRDKLEQLNRQVLNVYVVLSDPPSIYEDLLTKLNTTTLEAGRVQSMMTTSYKCLHGMAPPYLRSYSQEQRVSNYNLRNYDMLEILYVRLAPIVYDLLDTMLLMPGMALLMISEILIACNF